ncbi:Pachytene checkpoint protein 2 [Mortierella sp. AM989]|nr:Pachytene checkpoint protein 2 [Mortierella sp. AM989]
MRGRLQDFLCHTRRFLTCFKEITDFNESEDELIRSHVERIWVGESVGSGSITSENTDLRGENDDALYSFEATEVDLAIYVYQAHDQGATEEYGDSGFEREEAVMMAHHWTLPCNELEGIWSSLEFDGQLQTKLLEYVRTTILFSDKNVNPDLISWNRVVLLHGPPGTGKTSLSRGLAQKLSIRLQGRYQYGKLLEINSHSLFSKWFSESGKMVQRMFDQIWSLVEDENAFVCVLIACEEFVHGVFTYMYLGWWIDEVESLAAARRAALSGNEPSDSIRVVNALLTQIDRLKKQKNVLILATSNITEAIDIAFIDRADIKLHIDLPSQKAIYNIFVSSLEELQRASIIQPPVTLMNWREYQFYYRLSDCDDQTVHRAQVLYQIAGLAAGMSGRAIRKLPFLAHAGYIQSPTTAMDIFLAALQRAVEAEQQSSSRLKTLT